MYPLSIVSVSLNPQVNMVTKALQKESLGYVEVQSSICEHYEILLKQQILKVVRRSITCNIAGHY